MQLFSSKIWLAIFFTLLTTTVGADGHWNIKPNLPAGTIICETLQDVEAYVQNNFDYMKQPGCGKSPFPLLVQITIETYMINEKYYALLRYTLIEYQEGGGAFLITIYGVSKVIVFE